MSRIQKVLLVDDDASTRHLFETVLNYYGIALSVALSENEALAQMNAESPDIVVLDIVLPGKDGYKVLKTLRANASHQCPVVATTAYYTLDSVPEFQRRGFDGYLLKPISPEQLVGYLEQVVASAN